MADEYRVGTSGDSVAGTSDEVIIDGSIVAETVFSIAGSIDGNVHVAAVSEVTRDGSTDGSADGI